MGKTKKKIQRKDWVANFNCIGEAKVNEYTYKIDEKSKNSSWVYNSLNLGIDCGEKHGVVYTELMGGYSEERENVIFAHGKDDDGRDDFENQFEVAWEDRHNEEILETIGDLSFITVGLEKTDQDKTFYKKFLSAYDAIAYVKENLADGMVVNVRGSLKYTTYQDKVQVRKEITSIVLSKADDVSKYRATFNQSMLLGKDSVSLKEIDKAKGILPVNARILDYVKEIGGKEVRGQYPFEKTFEFELDIANEKLCKAVYEKLFKVKKGVTQITFEGDLIEGGAVVTATLEDLPQDILDLIECGVYTEEDALAKCSANGNREQRMVLRKPMIRMVERDDEKIPVIQKYEERYTEDDLILDYLYDGEEAAAEEPETGSGDSDDSMDWLNQL